MKVAGRELFNLSEVNSNIDKFDEKMQKSETRISDLEQQLIAIEEHVQYAIEQDILSDGGNQKQVQNILAKKSNIQSQIEIERLTLETMKDVSTKQLKKAIPEIYEQFIDDSKFYRDTVEDEIFRQLAELRKEQERLLLLLNKARSQADNDTHKYKVLKSSAGYAENEYQLGNISGEHNNPSVVYKRHPEFGKPLLNMPDLRAIETRMKYDYVEANNLIPDVEKRVPKPTVSPEDLQNFLDSLEVKVKEKERTEE